MSNTTGSSNAANGFDALYSNTTGDNNTANGFSALLSNTTGNSNTANGLGALQNNTIGGTNTANGKFALYNNLSGNSNMASGVQALFHNTTGGNNLADGVNALFNNTTGHSNLAFGTAAGMNLTTGSNNIEIGNVGVAAESNAIRIGTVGTQQATYIAGISGKTVAGGVTVMIDSNGHLGTLTSSARFKNNIQPMAKASEAILSLQPVTFRYKKNLDPDGIPQFGLVAEQVAKVDPDLVARDAQGKPYTVRYEAVNAMLLNEFLKEHRKVEEQTEINQRQEATIARQEQDFHAAIAQQQKEIEALTAALKAQAAQIQKVSDQLESSKAAPRIVANDQ